MKQTDYVIEKKGLEGAGGNTAAHFSILSGVLLLARGITVAYDWGTLTYVTCALTNIGQVGYSMTICSKTL
jgi:hypothetical protein